MTVQYFSTAGATGWYLGTGFRDSGTSGNYFNWIGYWPASDFTGTMQSQAYSFQVGGEVFDSSKKWVVQMGSGADPNAGFQQAAYSHQFGVCTYDIGCTNSPLNFLNEGGSEPGYAILPMAPSPPTAGDTIYFYYGTAEQSFWGKDYGTGNAVFPNNGNSQFPASIWAPAVPSGDWAPNEYKGQCGVAKPLIGLSKATSGLNQAHGIMCGAASMSGVGTGNCNVRTFPPDSRGYNDHGWDWDPNHVKGECAANEYVQGVAQTASGTAGVLNKILCCPGTFNRNDCAVKVFYSGNSNYYSSPDWDSGYYKGQCGPGGYMAGVSVVANASEGVVGAPHAILCCQTY